MVLPLRAVRRTNCSLARSGRIGMRCYPVLRHARGNSAPVRSRDSGIRDTPMVCPSAGVVCVSLFRIYRPVNWEMFRIYLPDFQGH